MTDKVYTQQELKEMADQLLAADDKRKAGKAAAQKAEEAKPAADKALEEKLAKCPAAALLAGNEKLRELFIKGKKKGRLEPAELSEVVDPLDLDGDQMDRIYDSLADLGIEKSGLDRLIQCSYELLGLISFLTYGKDECRAWTICKGTKAPQAAGKIHSDIERGFIRAETINFDEMMACGSVAAAKEKGLLRSEGKDYVVKDGEIIVDVYLMVRYGYAIPETARKVQDSVSAAVSGMTGYNVHAVNVHVGGISFN